MAMFFWKWINQLLLKVVPNPEETALIIQAKLTQGRELETRELIYKRALLLTPIEVTNIMKQAMIINRPSIIEECLKSYPRVDEVDLEEILTLAIRGHHEGTIIKILQPSIDWARRNVMYDIHIIRIAIIYRRLDIFKRLINLGAGRNLGLYEECEILEKAIDCENLDYLRLLITDGIDVNAKNLFGATALTYAVTQNKLSAVILLLEANVNSCIVDHFDQTPLEKATRVNPEILKILLINARKTQISSNIREYLLERAASAPHKYAAKNTELLLEEGINVDSLSRNQRCAVVAAIVHHNDEVLKLLIKNKANLKNTSREGENALHVAVRFGTIYAVEMILKTKECDVNQRTHSGETALTWAFKIDGSRKMEALLQHGALLYLSETPVSYISTENMPWFTPSIFIPLLARERVGNRVINKQDVSLLKSCYPRLYMDYKKAREEWELIIKTNFIRGMTLNTLLEKSTNSMLQSAKSFVFKKREAENFHYEFPIYGSQIMRALQRIVNKRLEWKEYEEKIGEATYGYIPDLITERIAYYLSLD